MYRVISNGIPGTDMTPQRLSRLERLAIVGYLRSHRGAEEVDPAGDVAAGKRLFDETGCGVCHAVGGVGGAIGPDLSRVGATRGGEYLRQKIRDPDTDIMPQYESVTVVRRDHRSISGIRLNEDTFSIQLMDVGETLHMYLKSELTEIRYEKRSLMPAYGTDVLDEKSLVDVLAFLASLKG
jgi:putative heme-binding domain-containing protein